MIRRAYKVVNPRGKWNTGIFNYARNLATYKTSTGLVGLEVDPEGKTTLLNLSGDVLESVKKIPEHSEYRKNVEKWFKYISAECSKTDDIKAIEQSCPSCIPIIFIFLRVNFSDRLAFLNYVYKILN